MRPFITRMSYHSKGFNNIYTAGFSPQGHKAQRRGYSLTKAGGASVPDDAAPPPKFTTSVDSCPYASPNKPGIVWTDAPDPLGSFGWVVRPCCPYIVGFFNGETAGVDKLLFSSTMPLEAMRTMLRIDDVVVRWVSCVGSGGPREAEIGTGAVDSSKRHPGSVTSLMIMGLAVLI